MAITRMFRTAAGMIISGMLLLAGCSGGSGDASSARVAGIASEGALIEGKKVQLKDANNKTADAVTGTGTGAYSIDVTELKAPFLLTVTGDNGTYVSFAQAAGTANINPITNAVVALAAGNSNPAALFSDLTANQLFDIKQNYEAQAGKITTALATVLSGASAYDYFIGKIEKGKGIDALFDAYRIVVSSEGISIQNKSTNDKTVLTSSVIPAATLQPVTATPAPPQPALPAAPSGVTATGDDNQTHVSWGAVSGATSYNIYWSSTSGVTKETGTKIASISGLHYAHSGLSASNTYYYIVTAQNSAGESAASDQASATTFPIATAAPEKPVGVSASSGTNQVTVSWTPVSGATSYNIYWTNDPHHVMKSMGAAKIANVTSPYRHINLAADTPYAYVVTAVNAAGESGESEIASATTSSIDGAALYATNCARCHRVLATSSKKGASATQIQASGMSAYGNLAAAQVQAIADVLGF